MIQPSEQKRYKVLIGGPRYQSTVEKPQDLPDVIAHLHERSQMGAGRSHQQCGAEPMSGHVADGDCQRSVDHRQVVEIVSGRKFRWRQRPGDVETSQRGGGLRKESFLDLLRHL